MTEWVSGSIYIRANGDVQGVKPGTTIHGHKHHFDHTSIFFNGHWVVKRGDEVIKKDGPFFLLIDKDQFHEFTYSVGNKEPGFCWCVFSHRTSDGEIVETYTGWKDAHQLKERHPNAK